MVYPINLEDALKLYDMALYIREVEMQIASRYPDGQIRCPTHLSVGQEMTPAAIALHTSELDLAVSTHRSHAHYLAKGGSLEAMVAELYGLEEGCSLGRGGSMHLIDERVGFMGSSSIVGNSIPVGAGLAYGLKLDGQESIAIVYLGDGAVEEGVFYESVNLAATLNLPVLFVCENNGYSVYSDMSVRQPEGRKIHEMVAGLGIKTFSANSFQVSDLVEITRIAVQYVRNKRKPVFLEVESWRFLEHCGPGDDDHLGYRDPRKVSEAKTLDPLRILEELLANQGALPHNLSKRRESIDATFSSIAERARLVYGQ